MSFHDPEGYIDSTDYPPLPLHGYLQCTYNVTVYTGYGVELQVSRALEGIPTARPPWSPQQMMPSTHSLGHLCPLDKIPLSREKIDFSELL